MNMEILRKNIYIAELTGVGGSTQKGIRPVVIVSNDLGNQNPNNSIVTVVPITTNLNHNYLPTHVPLFPSEFNNLKESAACCEQVTTINKEDLIRRQGVLSNLEMLQIEQGIRHALFML